MERKWLVIHRTAAADHNRRTLAVAAKTGIGHARLVVEHTGPLRLEDTWSERHRDYMQLHHTIVVVGLQGSSFLAADPRRTAKRAVGASMLSNLRE